MNRAQVTLSLIFLAGLFAFPVTGCSRQQEGERCDVDNADEDCDRNEDLVCTDAAKLRGGDDKVSRCCPENLNNYSDSRCAPDQGGTGDGDGDGLGGAGGGTGSGTGGGNDGSGGNDTTGLNDVGEPCNYTSDCLVNLTCGPNGVCQLECIESRDCSGGKVCEKNICVAK